MNPTTKSHKPEYAGEEIMHTTERCPTERVCTKCGHAERFSDTEGGICVKYVGEDREGFDVSCGCYCTFSEPSKCSWCKNATRPQAGWVRRGEHYFCSGQCEIQYQDAHGVIPVSEPVKRPCARCKGIETHHPACKFGNASDRPPAPVLDEQRVPEPAPLGDYRPGECFAFERPVPERHEYSGCGDDDYCIEAAFGQTHCGQSKDAAVHQKDEAGAEDEYLQASCTESECKLCRLAPYARKSGMKHSGLVATAASLGVEAQDSSAAEPWRIERATRRQSSAAAPTSAQACTLGCETQEEHEERTASAQAGPSIERLRNQAENIVYSVFGFPASAVIGRKSPQLVEAILAALKVAYKSATPTPTEPSDAMFDEVERRMEAVVDAAVAWRQSDDVWNDDLEKAVDSLLELRDKPTAAREHFKKEKEKQ